jgi:phosphate transport system protein
MLDTSRFRPHFQSLLNDLQDDFLELVKMVTEAFQMSLYSLKTGNVFQAERVIERDKFINARRYEMEDSVLYLLTLQQPILARDLRFSSSMILFASELERMGDYAKGIATIARDIHQKSPVHPEVAGLVLQLDKMGQFGIRMLKEASEAFVLRNTEKAHKVAQEDNRLDEMYREINLVILDKLLINPETRDSGQMLNWALHNIERLGDRVVNLCERIVFIETGQLADF